MYGVIVVPTTATMSSSWAVLAGRLGVTRALPTAPQSGCDSTAEAM